MKFLHLSDLHIGKRVNGFSMIEDQRYILSVILKITDDEKPDGILIAGDIYDRSVPPVEAVELFDDFIVKLAENDIPVFIISGNHDSPERLAFCSRLMDKNGIHISPAYDGDVRPVTMHDSFGPVNIFLLPFIKPANVRRAFSDDGCSVSTYSDAVREAVDHMDIDPEQRNILVTHQFVAGAARSDSEEMNISAGGTDNVEPEIFSIFDYTALGHIHRPQYAGSSSIRYCGTPLKYSFSEASHEKSVTVAELYEKGDLNIRTVPLVPLREMREIKGSYEELTARDFYKDTDLQDAYVHITLTDENDIPDAPAKLRVIYRNLMKLDYDNLRTSSDNEIIPPEVSERRTPQEYFRELYMMQNNQPMSPVQSDLIDSMIEEIWEDAE